MGVEGVHRYSFHQILTGIAQRFLSSHFSVTDWALQVLDAVAHITVGSPEPLARLGPLLAILVEAVSESMRQESGPPCAIPPASPRLLARPPLRETQGARPQ